MLFSSKKCPKCDSNYDEALITCPVCNEINTNPETQKISKQVTMLNWLKQLLLMAIGTLGLAAITSIVTVIAAFIINPDIDFTQLADTQTITETFIGNAVGYSAVVIACGIFIIWSDWKVILPNLKRWQTYVFAIIGMLVLVLFGLLYSKMINSLIETGVNANQSAAIKMMKAFPVGAVIVFAFLGPIAEEFTYRLGVFSFARRINIVLAYIISTLVFAFAHFNFSSIGKPEAITELLNLPSYLFAGVVLAYIYDKYGLFASILCHITYNLYVVIYTLCC